MLLRLRTGQPVSPEQRSGLVLSYVRTTAAQQKERETRRRVTKEIVEPEDEPPPFEHQEDFKGAIGLI